MPAAPDGTHWCDFDTPIGRCRLGWSARGLTHLRLPETDEMPGSSPIPHATPVQMTAGAPAFVREALVRLDRYFRAERESFDGLALDLTGLTESRRTLYETLCKIGWGETVTYGTLAVMLGEPGGARAVGRAMGANPIPVIIPCHRVLAAGGRMGGFSAPGGTVTKQQLLALEGVELEETRQMGFGF